MRRGFWYHSSVAVAPMSNDFSDLRKGMRARVIAVPEHNEFAERLQELGLTRGTEFEVTQIAPLGDPIEIALRGYRLCLRRSEAAGFQIEVLP